MMPKIVRLSNSARVFYLLAPSAALLTGVIAIPILSAIYGSLFSDPMVGAPRYIGVSNYIEALTSTEFWAAVQITGLFAAASVILEIAIGLGLALIMHYAVAGRLFIRATVLAPWTIPSAIAAVLWSWMLQPSGIVNHLLGTQVLWIGDEWASKCAILMIDVWKTSPFVALLLLSGLQTIPEELYLAAKIDGAGPWQCFTRITLPMLRPALLIAVLFRTLDALRIYDIPAILTGGANDTTTISVLVVRAITDDLRTNYGSALSTITFVFLFSVSLALIRLLMPQRLLLEAN